METHLEAILSNCNDHQSRVQLSLQTFYRTKLNSATRTRNETACKKCSTEWTAGQFTLKLQPSNHKRKIRRQCQIGRIQKALKNSDKTEVRKLQRQCQRLQEQNNHVAIYKCDICKASTRVQLWKPKPSLNKQAIKGDLTAAKDEKHEELTNKPKKNRGKKKKKKTAGLIIPLKEKAQDTKAHKQLSIAKISNMFQQTATKSQVSKLNQFLK